MGMGEEFRTWYGQISQIRSLLPAGTPVTALTATATQIVKDRIVHTLQMTSVRSIHLSANRANIRYTTTKVSRDIHTSFKWLVADLRMKRTALPRVIIYCRSIGTCASLYKMFITSLKENSYEPPGSHPSIKNHLFAMYHARVSDDDEKQIMDSMSDKNGICRVLFCTTAFGMGVDVPNVRTVIHFGPPRDIDDYF